MIHHDHWMEKSYNRPTIETWVGFFLTWASREPSRTPRLSPSNHLEHPSNCIVLMYEKLFGTLRDFCVHKHYSPSLPLCAITLDLTNLLFRFGKKKLYMVYFEISRTIQQHLCLFFFLWHQWSREDLLWGMKWDGETTVTRSNGNLKDRFFVGNGAL